MAEINDPESLIYLQKNLKISQRINRLLEEIKIKNSRCSNNYVCNQILSVVLPIIIERMDDVRSVPLDGVKVYL